MDQIEPHESFDFFSDPEETLLYRYNDAQEMLELIEEIIEIDRKAMEGEFAYDIYKKERKEAAQEAYEKMYDVRID